MRLRSQPTDNITIYVASSDTSEGTVIGTPSSTTTQLERGPDGDDHGVADNLSDGDQSYAIRLMADNTTSDLGYKYVDPEDVTVKNLDTEKGGYYVSSVSGDTDEIRRRLRSRCVCEVSRPTTSRSMWLLRIRRAKLHGQRLAF